MLNRREHGSRYYKNDTEQRGRTKRTRQDDGMYAFDMFIRLKMIAAVPAGCGCEQCNF